MVARERDREIEARLAGRGRFQWHQESSQHLPFFPESKIVLRRSHAGTPCALIQRKALLAIVVNAIIQNAGQTCSAGSRVLVQDGIYDRFVGALADRFAQLTVGSSQQDLDVGPVINPAQRARVEQYLDRARADGLPILAQGKISPDAPAGGFYVKPTLIGNVPESHALAQEEVFGPVLSVLRFSDEADALRIANGTPYGLVAGAWTRDGARQLRLARALEAGQVFINNYGAGGGVELPFGGVKHSGHGREKGFEALFHFSTIKTVAIKHG